MNTKAFEVVIHSQFAFDACRKEVYDYEDCRQTGSIQQKNPRECREKSRALLSCYKTSEKMEPLCLDSFNDARECMFKSDGNALSCREFMKLYANCQKNPEEFKSFLEASTEVQRAPKRFDFIKHRGVYNFYG